MQILVWLLIAVSTASEPVPRIPAIQNGIDAFQRGDYPTAASTFRTYLYNQDDPRDPAIPWAAYLLGLMYQKGLGVDQDKVRACALLGVAARGLSHVSESTCRRSELTLDEILDVDALMSCYREGPPSALFDLAERHWVSVGFTQITIGYEGKEAIHPFALPGDCRKVVLPVIETEVASRHFLEVFWWGRAGAREGVPSHELTWSVFEIRGDDLVVVPVPSLGVVVLGNEMPPSQMPPGFRNFVGLRANKQGQVEWTLATTPRRFGLIPPQH